MSNKTLTKLYLASAIIILIVVLVMAITGGLEGSSSSSSNGSVCKSCNRTFTDSDNKMSIARTHMCSNCYANFKYMSNAIGK